MIRLVLIDDQMLVRSGVRKLLELTPDIQVVGEAADGEAGLRVIAAQAPDVVLLDIRMPQMSGLAALAALRESGESVPVIMLTTFDDDEPLIEAIKAGARGFLLKDVSLERLADAIRTVTAGGTLIQPAVTEPSRNRAFARGFREPGPAGPPDASRDRGLAPDRGWIQQQGDRRNVRNK